MTKCAVTMSCFNVFGDLLSRCPISSVRVSAIPFALQLKGAFRCGREDSGPFVEVLVVGDVRLDSRHRPVAKRAPRMPLPPVRRALRRPPTACASACSKSSRVTSLVELVGFGDRQHRVDDVRVALQLLFQPPQCVRHPGLDRIAHQVDTGHQKELLGPDEHQPDESHRAHFRQLP